MLPINGHSYFAGGTEAAFVYVSCMGNCEPLAVDVAS